MTAPSSSRRPRWGRQWPWVAGAVVLGLVVAGLWPRALPVEVAAVSRGPLAVTVNEEGMTRVRNRHVISAPMAGQLRRIDLKPGAPVEAGRTVLAELESAGGALLDTRSLAQAEARARAAAAGRELAVARRDAANAAAQTARTELARSQQLAAAGALARRELESAELRSTTAAQEARAAEFAVRVSEFELAQAEAAIARGRHPSEASAKEGDLSGSSASEAPVSVVSPVSGRILRVFQESARVVMAGTDLVEVGDPTDLEARIEVLSRDAVGLAAGARVALEKWGGPAPLAGRVRVVEPAAFTKISALGVEEQRVIVVIDFTDPPAARPTLGDAYRVEARIVTWEAPDVLKVPAGALFQRGEQWQVYAFDGGKARIRNVRVGHSNGIEAEVLEGLREGDRVVVYPGDMVEDGTSVRAVEVE